MYYDATGSNPPSILQGHTFDLLKENSTEQLTLAQEKWQNLKIYLDTDYNKITVEIDGVKSAETKGNSVYFGQKRHWRYCVFTPRIWRTHHLTM
ncbi:MAG: hypothetical protein L6V93_17660 [Clostridiales bacterium]|nr:MAG: hypothetical protein L6V93_17660 [Clostridiales bacterium]